MKKKPAAKKAAVTKSKPDGLIPLIAEVRSLIQSARHAAASTVNTLQVLTNFEIGRRIVEHEQKGKKRAAYGAEMLRELSEQLTEEFGRGFSVTNLKLMRQFFVENQHRIGQQATDQLALTEKCQQATDQLAIQQQATGELTIAAQPMRKSPLTFICLSSSLFLCVSAPLRFCVMVLLVLTQWRRDANIHAKEYQRCPPSKELLKAKLIEWARVEGARA